MSRLILVLGMHRSGTSLVAKSLECLGVSLGDRAEWSAPDNPQGFWEDQDVLHLNEAVLQRMGSSWHSLDLDLNRPTIVTDLRIQAQRILRDRLHRFPLFGLKEPRMCRLLPFWLPVIQGTGCEVGVVQVLRSPFAVATSLLNRNGRDREHWLKLDTDYNRRAWLDLPKKPESHHFPLWPMAAVIYESMIQMPAHEVRGIGRSLGLTVDEAKLDWFCTEFVRR